MLSFWQCDFWTPRASLPIAQVVASSSSSSYCHTRAQYNAYSSVLLLSCPAIRDFTFKKTNGEAYTRERGVIQLSRSWPVNLRRRELIRRRSNAILRATLHTITRLISDGWSASNNEHRTVVLNYNKQRVHTRIVVVCARQCLQWTSPRPSNACRERCIRATVEREIFGIDRNWQSSW